MRRPRPRRRCRGGALAAAAAAALARWAPPERRPALAAAFSGLPAAAAPRAAARGRRARWAAPRRAEGSGGAGGQSGGAAEEEAQGGRLAVIGLIVALALWGFSWPEEIKRAQICPRSKQFERDYFADPAKAAYAESKGFKYLQDPNCIELDEFLGKVRGYLPLG